MTLSHEQIIDTGSDDNTKEMEGEWTIGNGFSINAHDGSNCKLRKR
jgi:hypothetical protein